MADRIGHEHTMVGLSLDELRQNMREVIAMLLEDGEPAHESEFVGTEIVEVS